MLRLVPRSKFRAATALLFLAHSWTGAIAESIRFKLVSRDVVEARLRKYTGSNKEREATLRQLFSEAGCDGQHLSEQPVKGSKLPNVICFLPGSSDKVIIVGAHFDRVSRGDGVVDNWQVAVTEAMVNMDTLGLANTEVWASHSDKTLITALFYTAQQLNAPVTGVNVEQVGSTDSEQFSQRKIPSITIHSLSQETWNARILHTYRDRLSAIRMDDYYQTYHVLSA